MIFTPAVDAGPDERRREVRARATEPGTSSEPLCGRRSSQRRRGSLLRAAARVGRRAGAGAGDDRHGRLLVTLKPAAAAHAAAVRAVLAAPAPGTTRRRASRSCASSRRPAARRRVARARSPRACAPTRAWRASSPSAASRLRYVPNDPALHHARAAASTGTVTSSGGPRARTSRPRGTSRAATARRVAVIDTGVDGAHPELADRSSPPPTSTTTWATARRPSTRTATARTSRRWPARQPDNGIGLAGAGLGCNLLVVKSDLTDAQRRQGASSGRPTTAPRPST